MKRGCKHISKDMKNDPLIDLIAEEFFKKYPEASGDSELTADYVSQLINEQMIETEDKVLREVARQCLGREFTPEDADMFTITTHQDWEGKYQLNYLLIPIGMIERNYGQMDIDSAWENRQPKFGVTFTPFEEFKAKE